MDIKLSIEWQIYDASIIIHKRRGQTETAFVFAFEADSEFDFARAIGVRKTYIVE